MAVAASTLVTVEFWTRRDRMMTRDVPEDGRVESDWCRTGAFVGTESSAYYYLLGLSFMLYRRNLL